MPVKQAFGSPGGKIRLAPRIVKLIPKHTTYVEPYAGGAAVFWRKEPSHREVLNDKDAEIAAAYRFLKSMTDDQFRKLKQYDWIVKKSTFLALRNRRTKSPVERFRRFYYLNRASFAMGRTSFGPGQKGMNLKTNMGKFLKCKARLREVTILSMDGAAVISRYNSTGTFFYVDPPYPKRSFAGRGAQGFDEKSLYHLVTVLNKTRGKFILSLGTEHEKLLPKSLHIKKVKVRRHIVDPKTGKPIDWGYEILAANFKI